jgi:hypothetical protein
LRPDPLLRPRRALLPLAPGGMPLLVLLACPPTRCLLCCCFSPGRIWATWGTLTTEAGVGSGAVAGATSARFRCAAKPEARAVTWSAFTAAPMETRGGAGMLLTVGAGKGCWLVSGAAAACCFAGALEAAELFCMCGKGCGGGLRCAIGAPEAA